MSNLLSRINETVSFLQQRSSFKPDVAMVLGSGLGNLVNNIDIDVSIPYEDIPHFPVSTVKGHSGKLVLGRLANRNVVVMQGRFHYYEGYSMEDVTFPIRVMKFLGATSIMISNASGGLNPLYKVGDLMILRDHINLVSDHPLRGPNDESIGTRFPDQHRLYDVELIKKASDIAKQHDIVCHQGVYVGVTGPTFETPAEYKYMHVIGGDAVGMSTIPEVMVANHMGMRIFAISVISDEGNPPVPVQVTHDDVVKAAAAAEPKMSRIIHELLPSV
ncbi:MAG TPA: purine-nucleoside phosphorylase [Chitinophagales bacterium]|nr:purine-nucleoside phosphorylase [Chitinophagales bacterium]